MSHGKITEAIAPATEHTPCPPGAVEPPEGSGGAIAVIPPTIAIKSRRKPRTKAVTSEGAVDGVAASEPSAAQKIDEPKPLPSGEEIAAACRTLLLDYLAGAAGLSPGEAEAAADRAVRALAPPPSAAGRDDTKLARLIVLLRRREGATLAEMVEATGWQTHSVRGCLSGTLKKKMDLAVASEMAEGRRIYRLPAEG